MTSPLPRPCVHQSHAHLPSTFSTRAPHNLRPRAVQKLIATLLKELDDCARAGIKDELASLDPLLRHVSVAEEPKDMFEFD